MPIAAAKVEDNIGGTGPGQITHQREAIFEQLLRVTVLLGRSGCGTSIEERPDIRGAVRGRGGDAANCRSGGSSFSAGRRDRIADRALSTVDERVFTTHDGLGNGSGASELTQSLNLSSRAAWSESMACRVERTRGGPAVVIGLAQSARLGDT
jgi:hypothetical protein